AALNGTLVPGVVSNFFTITTATEATNTVTITTSAAHNLAVGQTVLIAGVNVTDYNGTFVVTAAPIGGTTFTYSNPGFTNSAAGAGGTVTPDYKPGYVA